MGAETEIVASGETEVVEAVEETEVCERNFMD